MPLSRWQTACSGAADVLEVPGDVRVPPHNNDIENFWSSTVLPACGRLRRGMDNCFKLMFPSIMRACASSAGSNVEARAALHQFIGSQNLPCTFLPAHCLGWLGGAVEGGSGGGVALLCHAPPHAPIRVRFRLPEACPCLPSWKILARMHAD